MFSKIKGVGSYLPKRIVTNFDLEKKVATSDIWIRERTGIEERRFANADETASTMGFFAAKEALNNAKIKAEEIDLIIVATTTPDNVFPATATKIQGMLGIKHGFAYDIQASGSGFLYALFSADNAIKTGRAKTALIIGSEVSSKILDFSDRNTCVLFGDGAGAIILEKNEKDTAGIIDILLRSDGRLFDTLYAGKENNEETSYQIKMNGKEFAKYAVADMFDITREILAKNNLKTEDITYLIPQQTGLKIISSFAKKLALPENKIIINVNKYANTSAASIPLALTTTVKEGKISKGDLIVTVTTGAGLTWGSALIRW